MVRLLPFYTRVPPSCPLQLDLLLLIKYFVPDIQKNLISVYRLCNTNQVLVEFFPASFQVKDLSTGVPLLQGRTRNELYEWPMSAAQAQVFSAFKQNQDDS